MLHVLTGGHCNNRCVFCMESDREGRKRHVLSQTSDDIQRFIQSYPQRDEILFTSGEPTLNRELPRYVQWAKEAGYRTIAIISNGRRLSQPKYAAAMVRLGVNKFTISVHGHQAQIHDALTSSKGAFRQTQAALANIAALRRRGARLDLHTSTVVVRANLPFLSEIHEMLRPYEPDRTCFNVMMVKGFGAERFEELMPRYRDVAASAQRLLRGLDREALRRITLQDIPRCAVVELPPEVLHSQESFEQFETQGSIGIADSDMERMGEERAGEALRALRERASEVHLQGDGEYYVTGREIRDDVLRVKRPECERCALNQGCPGVWSGYVDVYGWDELQPINGQAGEERPRRNTKSVP
ncbi:MAG: radical SAM protein [Myxococcales bacterium]|nr:radical SAM protein [Myxococcales bacterium]